MANYNQLLNKKSEPKSYVKQLDPSENDVKVLMEAKQRIRSSLRKGIREATEQHFGPGNGVTPRFFTQGSWAYKTCNAPCQPHQEMDLDIGVYLPMENWRDGDATPSDAADIYFRMVEVCLKPLAKEEGWTFDNKASCVRLKINNGIQAHVDVPLYVAPKKEFLKITETAAAKSTQNSAFDSSLETFREQDWSELNHIALATRDEGWKLSDPRKVADYFNKQFSQDNGRQLRRICRYLKGARDHSFDRGGPSSVLLMVCASWDWQNYPERDDLALLNVLEKLGDRLKGEVVEPAIHAEEDLNRVPMEKRGEVKKWADSLYATLKLAVENRDPERAVSHLRLLQSYMDRRVPQEPELIAWTPSSAEIVSTPAQARPQPQNHEVTSG